ncbi:MAG: 50S ribosomal protein L10 [Bacteroidetes bacterium QS_1_65_9]|nr:MAG: 50S ribosomal protein L10 [Bacteroidetes bacterium QS_1_65_9]
MPLTRSQKSDLIDDIADQIEGASTVYLTDFEGLSVGESNELRHQFRAAGVEFRVVKNTLMELALERAGELGELADYLHGPTALAISEEPAAPARVIQDFTEEADTEVPALKVASVEGDLYPADALDQLAELKSRDELIGEIVTLPTRPSIVLRASRRLRSSTLTSSCVLVENSDTWITERVLCLTDGRRRLQEQKDVVQWVVVYLARVVTVAHQQHLREGYDSSAADQTDLALEQAWAGDAHVNVYLMADVERTVERLGDRGYRLAQLEAGVVLGRLYLATYAHGSLGGTGLTFEDRAVTDFLSPRAAEQAPMTMFALGVADDR